MYSYTVNDENTIEVFVEGQEPPMLRQPWYPNQDAFDTKEEAEIWAQLFIDALVDEDAPYAPTGKGIPGEPKPTKEEMLARLTEQAEQYGEDVPEQLQEEIDRLEAELAE